MHGMKMMDMTRPKPKPVEPTKGVSDGWYEQNPYEHRITLNKDDLKKLGWDVSKMKAGDRVTCAVEFMIKELDMGDSVSNGEKASCTLQMKKLGMMSDEKPEKKAENGYRFGKQVAKP